MIDLTKLSPEQAAGLSHVNTLSNAEKKLAWDATEATKVSAATQDAPYTAQPYVSETDAEYADRVLAGVFDSYSRQRLEFLKSQVLPALDDSKLAGLQKYLTASPELQAQIKQLLGV